MKAFIIKNKEGKYFQWLFNDEPDWEDKLYNSFMHYSKEDAEKSIILWQLEDCKVVEITIAEGDLEKELEYYFGLTQAQITEIDELKQQLAEKDKEIEKLKNCVMSKEEVEAIVKPEIADLTKQLTKELTPIIYKECRHQVCEEIREKLNEIEKSIANNIFLANETIKTETKQKAVYKNIFKILDQIEKGEIK